jgi:hypothetical protein
MGFDLHMFPQSGFLEWTDEQWHVHWRDHRDAEEQLGTARYVGFILGMVTHHLVADREGSQFPLLMRLYADERVGWYHHELGPLLRELDTITQRLAALPVTDATVAHDASEWARGFVADFPSRNPSRPLNNLADLAFHFFETLRAFASRAQAEGNGVFVSY